MCFYAKPLFRESFLGCLIFIYFLNISLVTHGQRLQIAQDVTIGDIHNEFSGKLIKTSDGGYATLSVSNSAVQNNPDLGFQNLLLTKLDGKFKKLWSKVFGKQYTFAETGDLRQTREGGFVITGSIHNDAWIIKTDTSGNLQWKYIYDSQTDEHGIGIEETESGDFMVLVDHRYTISLRDSRLAFDGTLIKLNINGILQWQKSLSSPTSIVVPRSMTKTRDGKFVGTFIRNRSADHYFGTFEDAAIIKFDENGNIEWQTNFLGNFKEELLNITEDASGYLYAVGYSGSTLDAFSTNRGRDDGWLVKLSPQGGIILNKLIGGSDNDYLRAIGVTPDGLIFIAGYSSSKDKDIADNISGNWVLWLARLGNTGAIKEQLFPGKLPDFTLGIQDIVPEEDNTVSFVAVVDDANPFVSAPIGGYDLWLARTGLSNQLKVTAYVDLNKDGMQNQDEPAFDYGKIEVTKTNDSSFHLSTPPTNGLRYLYLDSGSYTIIFRSDHPGFSASPDKFQRQIPKYGFSDSLVFRLLSTTGSDLQLDMMPQTQARPGFTLNYKIIYNNRGSQNVNSPEIRFLPDSRLTIQSTNPANYTKSGDTLIWKLNKLKIFESGSISIVLKAAAPPILNFGDTITSKAFALPFENDTINENNRVTLRQLVTGSYDPNDKMEFHGGQITEEELSMNEDLTYLIRFQNTGNDTAFTVRVLDTLDTNLDYNSMQFLEASHPNTLVIKNHRYLEWTFENILLPDSNRNEPASHGFIRYKIKPRSSLTRGQKIQNTANIYFDFNLPVRTNTHETTILASPLSSPRVAGLKPEYCMNEGMQEVKILNLPDSGVIASAKIDNSSVEISNKNSISFDVSKLSEGNHTLYVEFSSGGIVTNISVFFIIKALLSPEVQLSANITQVSPAITSIQLNAIEKNAGNAPLFVFTNDRTFNTILRAETNEGAYTMPTQMLKTGSQHIYVRLRVSEQCSSTSFAYDSILLTKTDVITNVVDPDFPSSIITVYPNPTPSLINISGLQRTKFYLVEIFTITGLHIDTKQYSNNTIIQLQKENLKTGDYIIRLTDIKKNRVIGSFQIQKY